MHPNYAIGNMSDDPREPFGHGALQSAGGNNSLSPLFGVSRMSRSPGCMNFLEMLSRNFLKHGTTPSNSRALFDKPRFMLGSDRTVLGGFRVEWDPAQAIEQHIIGRHLCALIILPDGAIADWCGVIHLVTDDTAT